jgi:hypothetical protein
MSAIGIDEALVSSLMGLSSTGMFFGGLARSFFFFGVDFSMRVLRGPKTLAPTSPRARLRAFMTSSPRDGVGGEVAGVLYG